jgi:broad specificity phosphatase PhoE
MSLPLDLVLIRHGQSEGNAAKRLSEQGDDTGYQRLKDLHTRSYRLSKKGQEQAGSKRNFILKERGSTDL